MCSSASSSVSSIDSFTPSMCSAGNACDVWWTANGFTADDAVLWPAFRPCFDVFLAFECKSGDKFSVSLSSSPSPPCKLAAFFSFTICMLSRFCCFDEPFWRGLRSRVVDLVALGSSFGKSTDIRICKGKTHFIRSIWWTDPWNLPLAEGSYLFYLCWPCRSHLDYDSMPQRPPWSNQFHLNRARWCPVDFWVMRMLVVGHSGLRSRTRPHSQAECSRCLFPAALAAATRGSPVPLSSFARREFAKVLGMVHDKWDSYWPGIATSQHTNCTSTDVGMEELVCREYRSCRWRIRLNCRRCRRRYLSEMICSRYTQ